MFIVRRTAINVAIVCERGVNEATTQASGIETLKLI